MAHAFALRPGYSNRATARVARFLALLLAVGSAAGRSAEVRAAGDPDSTADRLVRQALDAEAEGDNARYFGLLRDALRIAPDYELARWHLGQVSIDGQWISIEEAQRRASADPRREQYEELRQQFGETPFGQLELARWCRKQGLNDEAEFHWASVLAIDPTNDEALRAVGRRWHHGRLLTPQEIRDARQARQEARRLSKEWTPKIASWRRAIGGADESKRTAALDAIRQIDSPEVFPLMEAVTLGRDASTKKHADECRMISTALLEALGNSKSVAATESILRHALMSPIASVRQEAVDRLKKRPQQEFVPPLLAALSMPLESSFHVRTEPDGSVHYTHSLYRERAGADWSVDLRRAVMQRDFGDMSNMQYTYDVFTREEDLQYSPAAAAAEGARKRYVTANYQRIYAKRVVAMESRVAQLNEMTEAINSVIIAVLTAATGEDLGQKPTAWWNWWQDHNEYYVADAPAEHYYDQAQDTYFYGAPTIRITDSTPPPPPPPGGYSCFAKGTPVWTRTGQRPIESLEIGDLVLAQDLQTGELAFKPVIARTVRPPSEILDIELEGETLRTTLGHPLWVASVGWRMAKQLDAGAVLHALTGAQPVRGIETSGQQEAYNLVVADFNNYFVGAQGVLVHDNTPRRPVRLASPGLAAR